jgi:hypothetical protein
MQPIVEENVLQNIHYFRHASRVHLILFNIGHCIGMHWLATKLNPARIVWVFSINVQNFVTLYLEGIISVVLTVLC